MRSAVVVLTLLLLFPGIWYTLYAGSRFTYAFEAAHLRIRWCLPGGVPFRSRRIPYERIVEVRPFSWRLDATGFGEIWGNLPSRGAYALILSPSFLRRGPLRKLWITPSDFTRFAQDLARHGVSGTHAA